VPGKMTIFMRYEEPAACRDNLDPPALTAPGL
jgi:hypothetical protein